MNIAVHAKESSKEQAIREAMTGALEPGETLYEYTLANLNSGIWSRVQYWIGLTDRRFILMKPKKTDNIFSLVFPVIQSVGDQRKIGLIIQFAFSKETIRLVPSGNAQTYLAHIFELYPQLSAANGVGQPRLTAQQVLRQAEDLEGLNLTNLSAALINAQEAVIPGLKSEPDIQAVLKRTGDAKLAMRVAAVIYGFVILALLLMAIMGLAKIGLGIVLAILAIIELVRGSTTARGSALALSLLTAGLNVVMSAAAGSIVDALIWAAFGVAMIMLLTGKPGKIRTFAAVGIFILGFLTPMVLVIFIYAFGA